MQFAPLYPWIYRVVSPRFPGCLWHGGAQSKAIALTFDDGPHGAHTPPLLDVLAHHQVTASFFWLGVCVERFPDVANEVYAQGHWVGLHGYTHHLFPRLSIPNLHDSLTHTQRAIAQACHLDLDYVQQFIRDVRPPYGVFTPQILRQFATWGYRPVMWSVVPEDWTRPGITTVVRRILDQLQPGALIVLHDGYHGGEDAAATVDQLLPLLLQQGYHFVTVDQLWQLKPECQSAK